ncbi:MAG TPA: S8 family peptidase [bacterium]|nr:S8 family peptidase [bacterium]
MKKTVFLICVYLICFLFQLNAMNISPVLKQASEKKRTPKTAIIKKGAPGKSDFISVIIRSSQSSADYEFIKSVGGKPRSIIGDYITALIPVDSIPVFEKRNSIIFVSEVRKKKLLLDNARASVKADSLYLGDANYLSQNYRGNNVIVGIVDSGLDVEHDDFKDSAGKSRVLYLWDQTADFELGPSEIPNSAGIVWTKEQINNGVCSQNDEHGHGTHVAGIAAGNGRSKSEFRGIAPEADIIFVKTDFEHDVDGVNYIFKKAEALGRPAVVNMSLGGHFGPHDGTSNYEMSLETLTGRGKILVAAAGNEGLDKIHYSGTAGQTSKYVDFQLSDVSADLELWYDNQYRDKQIALSFQVISETGTIEQSLGPLKPGMYIEKDFDYPDDSVIDESENFLTADARLTLDPNNNASLVAISFGSKTMQKLRIIYNGNADFDMWMATNGLAGNFEQGDSFSTVGAPGTVSSAITVAAYTTKTEWLGKDGNNHFQSAETGWNAALNNIAAFSSRGPSRRPDITGIKPDISAPGELIFSAYSSASQADNKNKDASGKYVKMEGTSMATPVITGLAALLLQAKPNLNPAEVKQVFKKTAVVDAFTGTVPNVVWGAGKADGLSSVIESLGVVIDTASAVYTDTTGNMISVTITANTYSAISVFDSYCGNGRIIPEKVKVDILNSLPDGSSGDTITLELEFADNDSPVFMTVKNYEDNLAAAKINSASNSIIDFGGQRAYQSSLKTIRDISFIRGGVSYNSTNCFNRAKIIFTVPAGLKGYPLAVYYLDETDSKWKIISESSITYSAAGDTVGAEINHFSIYGLFAKGINPSKNLSDAVIFPNPFRPNDGNDLTGIEFSGSYNINNKTGIHFINITENSTIKIYEIAGRLAAEIQPIQGSGMAIWNGRLLNGKQAPSGLYLALIETGGKKKVEKIVIIR